EKVEELEKSFEENPETSLRKRQQELGIDRETIRQTAHNLGLRAYRLCSVHELLPADYSRRLKFSSWYLQYIKNNPSMEIFFTDEAWFHLSGYINSQNCRYWSAEKPTEYVESSLHPKKIGVWTYLFREHGKFRGLPRYPAAVYEENPPFRPEMYGFPTGWCYTP
ncbi:uncharacterized protein B4U80_08771, partial [Leptotrombidium deliense]